MQALLVVGGTDPSGGSGIHADVLHAHDSGVWSCPVVSAVTIQTPASFRAAHAVDTATFVAGLEAAAASVDIAGVKTGYLADPEQVEFLAAFIRSLRSERPGLPFVLDPTGITAPTAAAEDVARAIADKLLHLATIVTPTKDELAVLADHPVHEPLAVEIAAKRLVLYGPRGVLVTRAEETATHVTDRFVTRYTNEAIHSPRSPIEVVHGAGSALATRIAGLLVRGLEPSEAARVAAHEMSLLRPGARYGRSPTHALLSPQPLLADPEAPDVVRRLEEVVPRIVAALPAEAVLDRGNDIGYASGMADDDIAVLRQRIHLREGRPYAPGVAWREPTTDLARFLRGLDPSGPHAAVDLRPTESLLARIERLGLLGTSQVVLSEAAHEPVLWVIAESPEALVELVQRLFVK